MSSCNVNSPYNIVNVNPNNTNVIEVSTPGPIGPQGPPGDPSNLTGSFVTTGSFNAFTASYYANSASFSSSISQLQDFSSSLNATFVTEAELGAITGAFATTGSNRFNGNQIITGSLTVSGSSTFTNIGPAVFSGSVNVTQGGITGSLQGTASFAVTASFASNVPLTASFAISASQALTASYASNVPETASFAISASQALNSNTSSFQSNIEFAQSHIPFFDSNNSMSSSVMRQWTTESITINAEFGTANNPEALFVFQPNPDSINVITAEANVDNYVQFNLFNINSGSTASSDIVATADNGNEFINFIDMGINSSTFTGSIGGPNDAYLYSTGNDLTIGNATANKHIRFFVGGGLVDVYQKFVLNPDDLHEMTGSLDIEGALIVTNGITGSLQGTASFAITASYAANADINTGSFATTGSNRFNGNQTITGSLIVSSSANTAAIYGTGNNVFTVYGGSNRVLLEVDDVTSGSIYSINNSSNEPILDVLSNNTVVISGSTTITGSLNVQNGITGNLSGTASYALEALTASYAANALTASYSIQALSASFAITASYAANAGIDTGSFATTGSNIFSGSQGISGSLNVSGGLNVGSFISSSNGGYFAGQIYVSDLTIGHGGNNNNLNTAIGVDALQLNQVGSNNTAIGFQTLLTNTSGSNNVAVGSSTLLSNTSGSFNTGVGSNTLLANTTGSNNTALGYNAGALATGSGNVFLGRSAGALQTSGDNQLWIANNNTLTPLIKGDFARGILQLNTPSGSQITGSLSISSDLNVAGTITAQQLNVQVITSSISYITGSTIFGSSLTNTHEFTGSVTITGSLAVNNSNVILTNQTSSMSVLSASQAQNANTATSASQAQNANNAITASYVLNAVSASFATSASYAFNATSASQAINSNNAISASQAQNANNAITASYVLNAVSASYALSASQAQNANTATSASQAQNANIAISASQAQNANTATSASQAQNANNALTSSYSLNINGATNHVPLFDSQNSLVTSAIYQSNSFSVIINQDNNTTAAPEALYVFQPNTSSYNVISGKGNLNNYLQLNIQNLNNGVSASSDVVATANNGNETTNYIDMGINGANYTGILGGPNDAYLYSTGVHLHIGNASNEYVGFFAGGDDVDANMKLLLAPNNSHEMTGSLDISGSLIVQEGITGNLSGTASFATAALSASYAALATTASFALNFNPDATASFAISASQAQNANNATTASYVLNAVSASYALSASYAFNATSASFAENANLLDGKDSTEFATTGSNVFRGTQTVTGSLFTSGSNSLVGNTSLSGSIIISGSENPSTPTIEIFGDTQHTGVVRFNPISRSIDNSISASYIYVSGSTNDLYFTQNGSGYANTTRLRWLEGNLYTGLLNGGIITSQSSTVYQIGSGSGIIVNLNASLNDNPYPTIQYLNWGNLSASISAFTSSFQQVFVGVDSTSNIFAQGTPFSNGQFDTLINIGSVFFQNQSTINAVKTQPSVAYGFEQAQNVFNRAFGPLKLSGYTLAPSGSSTGSLVVGSGTAYAPGSNYIVDPNEPFYTVDSGTNTSKIWRYYQSGSTWVYDTNGGAGYTTIDPTKYSNNGVLSTVGGSNWSIQRVFWFPNSVTKAIIVYYGNARYGTEAEARANINFESFVEAPNTAANAIYLGAIIINGTGVFTTPGDYTLYPGGLFRQVGGSGGGGSVVTQTLSGLSDVAISGQTNLQPLVYSTTAGKWINSSNISGSLFGNAQTATSASFATSASHAVSSNSTVSASYALTASFALNVPETASFAISASQAQNANNAISASFATNSISASQAQNANNAISSSYALNATNATTASYVLNAVSASFATNATNAVTASYVLNAISASFATSASYALSASQATNANTATSASFATTSSYADNFIVKNTFTFDATFNDYATIASTSTGTNNLFTQPTGSFTSAFFKYTVRNGVNARTGEVMAIWNGVNVEFTDTSTRDLGNTSPVTMSIILAGGDVEFNAITNTSGWSVKSLATFM